MGWVLRRALGGADVSWARCANSSTESGQNRMRSAAHGARWHQITRLYIVNDTEVIVLATESSNAQPRLITFEE